MAQARTRGSGLEWFVRRGSVVRGPFTSTRVRHFVLDGKLALEDEVSPDRHEWHKVAAVPEVVPPQLRGLDAGLDVDADGEARRESGHALRTTGIVVLVIALLTLGVSLVGGERPVPSRDCAAAPRPGINLENCVLTGAAWAGAVLNEANLANARLTGAVLTAAELGAADLRYADLGAADLSYARLAGAVLKGANLRQADLTNADLAGADLGFADLSGARLGAARLQGARLEGAIWTDGRRCAATDCPR